MTRFYFFAIIAFVSINSFAQDRITLPIKDGRLYYEVIDSSIKMSKEEIFVRARTWVTKNFLSAKNVIDFEDKESGKLIAKGFFSFLSKDGMDTKEVNFMLDLTAKDDKFRIIFDNISAIRPSRGPHDDDQPYDIVRNYELYLKAKKTNKGLEYILTRIDNTFQGLTSSLRSSIATTSSDF